MDLVTRIEQIQRSMGLTKITLKVDTAFSSHVIDHREKLRDELNATLRPSSPLERNQLLSLSRLPTIPGFDISISHSHLRGGYLIVPDSFSVGLDIENPERVELKHVERISSAEERALITECSYLWVAKESAFKAFSKAHGLTLTADTVVDSVKVLADSSLEFEAFAKPNPSRKGRGWIFSHEGCSISVFFLSR